MNKIDLVWDFFSNHSKVAFDLDCRFFCFYSITTASPYAQHLSTNLSEVSLLHPSFTLFLSKDIKYILTEHAQHGLNLSNDAESSSCENPTDEISSVVWGSIPSQQFLPLSSKWIVTRSKPVLMNMNMKNTRWQVTPAVVEHSSYKTDVLELTCI